MIDRNALLDDLKKRVKSLEDDLREQVRSNATVRDHLQREYDEAREAERTTDALEVWQEEILTQASVAWVLSGVFVRFMEDNTLIEPMLSGPGERLQEAQSVMSAFVRAHPTTNDREYLEHIFTAVAKLPAVTRLFDRDHNPIWHYPISGDAARDLLQFWRRIDPANGQLIHDFTDETWDTRFLGDLYQDLSEAARKRYALLQTPDFVEEFILERTLNPAIQTFGLKDVRLIDPTCGSGHFLLGAFKKLLDEWFRRSPNHPERDLVQRALDGVYGVDINPFAAAIARFRLLVEALRASRITKLKDAPAYRINVTAGDSLLHGPRFGELALGSGVDQLSGVEGIGHAFEAEDLDELNRILGQQYHAVVGNPPYITPKNKALNILYRERYKTCHRKYSLGVPFTERFFQLAIHGSSEGAAGFVGLITTNSFMKREFGKKLIEEFLPTVDLSNVIDTSGAYIPGHGTPTVILFGRTRSPISQTIAVVMGIQGEPSTPAEPARGKVWSAVVRQVDDPGSESDWLTSATIPRRAFKSHPWSLQGGGATETLELVESRGVTKLGSMTSATGFGAILGEDDAYSVPIERASAMRLPMARPLVEGTQVRDWSLDSRTMVVFPYASDLTLFISEKIATWFWPNRTLLWSRTTFGGETYRAAGRTFIEYHQFPLERAKIPLSITFAFVATHNHFVLDRGGKVFKQTAPVIKLPADASENDHLALLVVLNSSTACFWMKQVCFAKDLGEGWTERYEFAGTALGNFPLPEKRPLTLAKALDALATERQSHLPAHLRDHFPLSSGQLAEHRKTATTVLGRMMALQEELDWQCYHLYGLTGAQLVFADDIPPIELGQRAFEIVMARKMMTGDLETTWFKRHGSTPITEIPDHWPVDYRELISSRIAMIESDRSIRLLEQPEYKRRWNQTSWDSQLKEALRDWLLERLESERYWPDEQLRSTNQLADTAMADPEFMHVAEQLVGTGGFEVTPLVHKLVEAESVPAIAELRFKPAGLRKRKVWERTWQLQREEDRIDAEVATEKPRLDDETADDWRARIKPAQDARKAAEVGDIPAPPKYSAADFRSAVIKKHRGALDVPKERFFSLPGCTKSEDGSLLVGWAGWNHLQRAQAIAARYNEAEQNEGWNAAQLKPMLAALAELVPWLKQWHNDIDPEFGERMGDQFNGFLLAQLQAQGLALEDLEAV